MPQSPRLLRPRASGFDPRSIAGLELWLDFGDSSTVTLSGSTISQVTDKSGKGRAAVQATGANQPTLTASAINGRSVASFDGTNDQLTIASFPAITALTAFLVVYRNWASPPGLGLISQEITSTSGMGLFVHTNNAFADWLTNDIVSYGNGFSSGRAPRFAGPLGSRASNEPLVMSCVLSSGGSGIWVNGSSVSTRVSGAGNANIPSGTLRIGAQFASSDFVAGNYAELMIFTTPLSTFDRQRVEGYLAWKYGRQAQLPYNHPYAASFPGYGSQTMPTDSDALTYLAAVATADGGTGVEVGVANAVDAFVKGCKADGIWSAIKASCILSGARTLSGTLVPLVGSAPTNNNFVAGDYNRKSGLVGDGNTKYIDTNRNCNADPQNSVHLSVYVSAAATLNLYPVLISAGGSTGTTGATHINPDRQSNLMVARNRNTALDSVAGQQNATGLVGASRDSASGFVLRTSGVNTSFSRTSQTPFNGDYAVYASDVGAGFLSNARLAFYSVGESLDLAALDTRVSALYTAIGAAIP